MRKKIFSTFRCRCASSVKHLHRGCLIFQCVNSWCLGLAGALDLQMVRTPVPYLSDFWSSMLTSGVWMLHLPPSPAEHGSTECGVMQKVCS